MKKLILVRAGSSAWEESFAEQIDPESINGDAVPRQGECAKGDDRRMQGTLPLPLSQRGKDQLTKTAELLACQGIEVIYSSGNESSGPTAEYLEKLLDVKVKKIAGMREVNCGLWQGLRIKDIKKRYGRAYRQWRSDPTSVCPPDGESMEEVYERILESLKTIRKKNKVKTVLLVAAPIAAGLVECIITNKDLAGLWDIVDQEEQVKIFELNGQLELQRQM